MIFISLWVYGITYGQVCNLTQIPPNLRESLRAYYPFCGNFQDISGNGYNGTLVGNVPFITDRMGTANAAIQGGGGYIPTSNQFFRFTRSDTFTVSVWFTVPAAGCPGRLLSTESGEGHFRIGYYGNGVIAVQFGDYMVDTVTLNTWHHLVYIYANRNERVYMDGVLKVTNYETNTTENLTYATPFTIGAKAAPSYDLWCGNIDEVGVWGRALSDCEVKQLYRLPNTFSLPIDKEYDPYPNEQFACADSVELYAYRDNCLYRWNTGDTTSSISIKYSGLYKITVTDTFGCSASDSIRIILSNADVLQNDTSICVGDSLMLQLKEGSNDPILYDFNECVLVDFINTDGGGAASSTVNGLQGCGLNLEWPARVESVRKGFSYGLYEVDMRPSLNIANQYFTVLGVNIDSRPAGTDDEGYGIYVNGAPVKISTTHPAQYPNWYHLRVNITPDSLFVWIDNTQLYAGKHMDFGPSPVSPISIGTFSSSFFDNVRYTPFGANQFIRWSNGDTTRSILVRPVATTVYSVSVTQNGLTCIDSVRVTVNGRTGFNPLPDTIRSCSKSILLDAGAGFATYQWSNGQNARQVVADSTGFYRIRATDNNGCSYNDSAVVSLLNADIVQSDTLICPGTSVVLSIDSLFPGVLTDRPPSIPASLYTFAQAYYPFSGNTNDYSKNNYTGYGTNVVLTTDRFGNPNSAYQFNGVNSRIFIPYQFFNNGWQDYTISLWFSPDSHTGTTGPGQTLIGTFPTFGSTIGYSYNDSRRVYHFKNSNTANTGWDILNNDPFNTGPLELGKWYHFIVVKRGLNYEYYLNGRLDKRVTTTLAPASENCTLQLGAMMPDNSSVFNGKMDEVMVFDRALDTLQLQQLDVFTPRVRWSTGDTTKSITVVPDSTTSYRVTVTNGITSCSDSIRVSVVSTGEFNPFPDTISVCGDSVLLDAGAGHKRYRWNTGDTTPSIVIFNSGQYKVEVNRAEGCNLTDSVFVSILKADILSGDTLICKGASLSLSIDSSWLSTQSFKTDLPPGMRNNLVAHFPFNGNANEILGNNGIAYNVLPTPDKNGFADSAFSFNGINSSIIPSYTNNTMVNSFTYAFWANPKASINVPLQSQTGNAASNLFSNPCVVHPIHGVTFGGDQNVNAGSGIYLGLNGLYLEEHSDGWEAVPLSYTADLSGWHHYTIVYDNKVPSLFIDGLFIKSGIPSSRNIYASLGKDNYPAYTRSGIGAGYSPPWNSTAQYYKGDLDDLMYFNRSLRQEELNVFLSPSVIWSTGDSTPRITVIPDTTTTYYVTVSNGITSCIDSVRVTVSAIKDFNPFPDSLCVCADSIVLDAGAGFRSYDWSTGDTTQRITVFRKGWHKVTVTNADGCRAEDSVFVRRGFADILQNDTSLRALTPFELSIDTSYLTENGFKVFWSTGDSTPFITVVPRQKTKYYVRVTDGYITCTDSITINVKCIGGYNPCPPKLAKCDRSVVLDAGLGYLSYLWSTGDTTQQITVTSNGYYTVNVFDSSGAFGEDSTYVNLLAISLQPRDTTICRGSSVQLTAGNFFNGNDLILPTFTWATGEQDTALTVSPGETTTYYASLTNANNSCRDSATVRVVVVDASLSIIGDTVLCADSKDSIVLRAGRGRAYQWLINGVVIAGANDSLFVTRQAGNFSVIVTDTLGCQDSSRVLSVMMSPLPVGTFLPPASNSFCLGDSVLLVASGADSYRWYQNGVPLSGATAARFYAKQAGSYSVVYVSDKGCVVPGDTIVLRASKKTKASFTYTTYCAGISSQFTSTSDTLNAGDLQYLWKFADGSTAGGPAISHAFARSGNYPVQLILTSFDCPNYADTATVNVNVQAPTPGIRYPMLNLTINVPVTLVARPLGNDFLWIPPNGLDNPRVRTPRLMPKENATFLIRISNTAGCVTTDTLGVQVFDGRDLFVARGFTPNNDGKNDRLYPISIGIVELRYFRIYNRWGNLVFQSTSLLPQDGWDGTYNGKAQTSDTYTWMAEGVDIEGKVIRRSGSSILIR